MKLPTAKVTAAAMPTEGDLPERAEESRPPSQATDRHTQYGEGGQAEHEARREGRWTLREQIGEQRDDRSGTERGERTQGGAQRRADAAFVQADFLEDELTDRVLVVGEDGVHEHRRLLVREAAIRVGPMEDPPLLFGLFAQLFALERDLVVEQLTLAADRDVFADAHAEGAGQESGDTGEDDDRRRRVGTGDTHDEGQVGDEAVVGPEDDRSKDSGGGGLVGGGGLGQRARRDRGRIVGSPWLQHRLPVAGQRRARWPCFSR